MNMDKSRRDFLRMLALGGLVAGGIKLALRRGDPACTRRFACAACNKVPDCPLTQAADYRQATAADQRGINGN